MKKTLSRDERLFRNVVIAYAVVEAIVIGLLIVWKLRNG
jgi:hypothetical protein